ncbi:MAG: hypothetical protein RBS39_04120 [Phycisphaerales bacterium]|nr:hypothetical protein [Phycisphaerales bacterium]
MSERKAGRWQGKARSMLRPERALLDDEGRLTENIVELATK